MCVCVREREKKIKRERDPINIQTCRSTTGVTKAVVCAILSVGWCI